MEAETRIYAEKNRPRWITIRAAIHHPSTDGVFAADSALAWFVAPFREVPLAISRWWRHIQRRLGWALMRTVLAISSSASSRLNSFRVHLALWCFMAENVAVHTLMLATTFAIFSCSCMLYAFGLWCLCLPCRHCTSHSFWTGKDNLCSILLPVDGSVARWLAEGVDDWYGLLVLPRETLNSWTNDYWTVFTPLRLAIELLYCF